MQSAELVGQKFGKLTVIEKTDRIGDRYRLWRCRCDCGNEIEVNTNRLRRGIVVDCGCEKVIGFGARAEDLTGRRFGRLVCVSRAENNSSRRVCWTCVCDCGTETVVSAHELKLGKTKSCGCLRRENTTNTTDLTGRRFHMLTVMEKLDQRNSQGAVLWRCLCDCGQEIRVPAANLMRGRNKSCGCLEKEKIENSSRYLTIVNGIGIEWPTSGTTRADNTSGFRGVSKRRNGKYVVSISLCKKRYYLGSFNTFEEAVDARKTAEKNLHKKFLEAYQRWEEGIRQKEFTEAEHPFDVEIIQNKDREFEIRER